VVEEHIVQSAHEAWQWAKQAGFPVVLKGLVAEKGHKTDYGLVKLSLSGRQMIEDAFKELSEKTDPGGKVIIQKQLDADFELIAGFIRDPHFGPCVMFGIGGILAELDPDVVFDLAPLDQYRAARLIGSIRNLRLLEGFRGKTALDQGAMARILVNLGRAGQARPQISQIDINPLVVSRGKPVAVDAGVVF
jgi:acetyltransferase